MSDIKPNSNLLYIFLLILSNGGKKTFDKLAEIINKSGDTIKKYLLPIEKSIEFKRKIARIVFKNKRKLNLILDATLIKKINSKKIEGTNLYYCCKARRRVMGYKVQIMSLADKDFIIPIGLAFSNPSHQINITGSRMSDIDMAKALIDNAMRDFKDKDITIICDGAYAVITFIAHCIEKGYNFEVRMHKNRKVTYKGKISRLDEIEDLKLKKNKQSKTIRNVLWHNMRLDVTALKRVNKNGDVRIVYYISPSCLNASTRSSEHVKIANIRWKCETTHRSAKQSFGLSDCLARDFKSQQEHLGCSLLAYSMCQLVRKMYKFKTPEDALRLLKQKSCNYLTKFFLRILPSHLILDVLC